MRICRCMTRSVPGTTTCGSEDDARLTCRSSQMPPALCRTSTAGPPSLTVEAQQSPSCATNSCTSLAAVAVDCCRPAETRGGIGPLRTAASLSGKADGRRGSGRHSTWVARKQCQLKLDLMSTSLTFTICCRSEGWRGTKHQKGEQLVEGSADTHIPIAGDANVVKLTGLTLSKKDGVRLSRSPRTYRATSPPSEYPTMEKRCTSPPSS